MTSETRVSRTKDRGPRANSRGRFCSWNVAMGVQQQYFFFKKKTGVLQNKAIVVFIYNEESIYSIDRVPSITVNKQKSP